MLWIIATELLKSNFVNMIPFKYFYQGKFFVKMDVLWNQIKRLFLTGISL